MLADLARHPATAQARRAPSSRAISSPTSRRRRWSSGWRKRFRDTDGDLKEVAKALVTAPEAWDAPRGKLKRPGEWIVGALRARRRRAADVRPSCSAQSLLGEPLWRPPAPKGFSDDNAAWLDGLAQRLDIANQLAQPRSPATARSRRRCSTRRSAPLASAETRQAIARAESRPQALALLLMSPEFQRR